MTNPVPESNPQPSQPTGTPTPSPTPQALSSESQRLYDYFKLIDPNQEAVGLDQVRPIYPKVGWNVILGHCAELEARSMLTKRKVSGPNGRGGYEVYTWQ